jgi:hypothetical protein
MQFTISEFHQKVKFFVILLAVGVFYISLINLHLSFTGIMQLDGIPGVMLGFYTCANMVFYYLESFLYGRELTPSKLSFQETAFWWGLNAIVWMIGVQDVVTGILRYSEIK